MKKFSNATITKLNFYVYALTYKENNEDVIFFIGKGRGNRVFEHFTEAKKFIFDDKVKDQMQSDKIKTINSKEVEAHILVGELSSDEALKIEASMINTMRRFGKQKLTNKIRGQHSFDPININVNVIDFKYSKPVCLEKFAIDNKLKILVLKSTEESYYSAVEKDFRGVLEGIWLLNKTKIEDVDFIAGVLKGTIYAVYRYIKGSYRRVDDSWTQDEWDRWNSIHIAMGRPEHYFLEEEDGNLEVMKKTNKGIMKLTPLAIPTSQNLRVSSTNKRDLKLAKNLINRTIQDKKVNKTRQGGRFYFGFDENNVS